MNNVCSLNCDPVNTHGLSHIPDRMQLHMHLTELFDSVNNSSSKFSKSLMKTCTYNTLSCMGAIKEWWARWKYCGNCCSTLSCPSPPTPTTNLSCLLILSIIFTRGLAKACCKLDLRMAQYAKKAKWNEYVMRTGVVTLTIQTFQSCHPCSRNEKKCVITWTNKNKRYRFLYSYNVSLQVLQKFTDLLRHWIGNNGIFKRGLKIQNCEYKNRIFHKAQNGVNRIDAIKQISTVLRSWQHFSQI